MGVSRVHRCNFDEITAILVGKRLVILGRRVRFDLGD
jgi:hypothetical protein